MRIAYLLSALGRSGGVNAVLQHSRWLHEDFGHEITIFVHDDRPVVDDVGAGAYASVRLLQDVEPGEPEFDIAIATYWETAFWLHEIPARTYAHFVQSLEDRFAPPRTGLRLQARASQGLPLKLYTEAEWISDSLQAVRDHEHIPVVRNGIDKDAFPLIDAKSTHDGPLRILIEGHPDVWFKSVPEARAVVEQMQQPHEVVYVVPNPDHFGPTLEHGTAEGPLTGEQLCERYTWADVVLKLSRVEGMFGPPLEGFHRGATCVVWPVTGHDEYIVHGKNGIVTDWDDIRGTARWLDILAERRDLLAGLQAEAIVTAAAWPSWRDQAPAVNDLLGKLVSEGGGTSREDLRTVSEAMRVSLFAADRQFATMGQLDGGWSETHKRMWALEAEVERMGGRKRERARRFAQKVYRRIKPVQPID
ncbi:MAG: hypothetical protein QM648_10305 [Solirubrobacterales bacterium]